LAVVVVLNDFTQITEVNAKHQKTRNIKPGSTTYLY